MHALVVVFASSNADVSVEVHSLNSIHPEDTEGVKGLAERALRDSGYWTEFMSSVYVCQDKTITVSSENFRVLVKKGKIKRVPPRDILDAIFKEGEFWYVDEFPIQISIIPTGDGGGETSFYWLYQQVLEKNGWIR